MKSVIINYKSFEKSFEVKFIMFSMIPCSSDCIYQVDGYCTLETPTIVTNITNQGCVHRIQVKKKVEPILTKLSYFKHPLQPQTPPAHDVHQ